MKGTGIKVTDEELRRVRNAQSFSGIFLSDGEPLGDPQSIVAYLTKKYNAPAGTGLNLRQESFVIHETF